MELTYHEGDTPLKSKQREIPFGSDKSYEGGEIEVTEGGVVAGWFGLGRWSRRASLKR